MRPGNVTRFLLGMLAVTLVLPALWGGGFDDRSRSLLIVLAGGLLLIGGLVDDQALLGSLASPLAWCLAALGALAIISAAWTIGSAGEAIRDGVLILAYVAVFAAARALGLRAGPLPLAWLIALLAAVEAVLGLRAVALHALPDAESIAAVWRPGGSFQYPPALALLQAGALPVFAYTSARRSAPEAWAGLLGAALAGAVLALCNSRLELVLVVIGCLWVAFGRIPGSRRAAITTIVVAGLGSVLALAVFHGELAGRSSAPGIWRLVAVLAGAGGLAAAGLAVERRLPSTAPRIAGAVVVVAALAMSAFAGAQLAPPTPHSARPSDHRARSSGSDLLHGRSHEWLAAVQTWLDRPVTGAGAGAYYEASIRHQTVDRSLFAHDQPLEQAAELGALGLVLAVALYAACGRLLYRARDSCALWLLGPLIIAFLISNLVDWTWHLAGLTAIWAAACGALDAEASRRATSVGQRPSATSLRQSPRNFSNTAQGKSNRGRSGPNSARALDRAATASGSLIQ